MAKAMLVFGPKVLRLAAVHREWRLAGAALDHATEYKYLGLELSSDSFGGQWNSMLSRIYTKARSSLNLVMFQCGGANGLRPRTSAHQWKSLCRPILEYGCEIWEGEQSKLWSSKLESVQSKFGRTALANKANPAATAVRADLGLPTLKLRRQCLKLYYWKKLCDAHLTDCFQ